MSNEINSIGFTSDDRPPVPESFIKLYEDYGVAPASSVLPYSEYNHSDVAAFFTRNFLVCQAFNDDRVEFDGKFFLSYGPCLLPLPFFNSPDDAFSYIVRNPVCLIFAILSALRTLESQVKP